ncbi:hypothetical protein [Algibacter aquimarinus]|uniref:Uncharacterized protein n=1 Tax=Algibacter aquimarinus TaxID=1136748 RepID=A0ABP9HGA7_9FLAO
MLLTITITLSALVFINLLLLKFSCKKVVNKKQEKNPVILKPKNIEQDLETLAPTGS